MASLLKEMIMDKYLAGLLKVKNKHRLGQAAMSAPRLMILRLHRQRIKHRI